MTLDNKPFKFLNIQFYKGNKSVLTQTSKLLYTADFLTLTLDKQKSM